MIKFHVLDANMPFDWFDFVGERVVIGDSELLIVTDDYIDNYPKEHPNKIALLIEPPLRKPYAYSNIYKNYKDFKHILTFSKEIVLNLPNAITCYFGGAAIPTDLWKIENKSKLLSMIVSWKNDLPGNQMRHQIIQSQKTIDVFGLSNPIPNNHAGLKDYMFNICIENSRVDWYYTEKICDCFAMGTVPIYWGTDTIGDFFNMDGIITFDRIEDVPDIISELSYKKYISMLDAVHDNFNRVQEIGLYDKNIKRALGKIL